MSTLRIPAQNRFPTVPHGPVPNGLTPVMPHAPRFVSANPAQIHPRPAVPRPPSSHPGQGSGRLAALTAVVVLLALCSVSPAADGENAQVLANAAATAAGAAAAAAASGPVGMIVAALAAFLSSTATHFLHVWSAGKSQTHTLAVVHAAGAMAQNLGQVITDATAPLTDDELPPLRK